MPNDYDVIIVGAGLVGLTLAALLLAQDVKVAVVDARSIEMAILPEHVAATRTSAINIASQGVLDKAGVWEEIVQSGRLSPFERMFVWDSKGRGEISFDCTEIAESRLGYILENAVISNALLNCLKKAVHVHFFCQHKPVRLELSGNKIQLYLSAPDGSNKLLNGQLLVGADGACSWVRSQANIDYHSWVYNHEALTAVVEVDGTHEKTAWQCFLPEGPLAFLPLSKPNMCSIVWSGPVEQIKTISVLKEREFNLEISSAFEYRLGNVKKVSNLMTFPLNMQHAKKYINHRVALIGDAAHAIHPLAGQGVNLGMLDAWCLARTINLSKQLHQDLGDVFALRKFERERKSDNWMMILGIEFFKRLFQSKAWGIAQIRSFGLNRVNLLPILKRQFMYKALGSIK
jgi:2-octaprenylphenol hydroxylase